MNKLLILIVLGGVCAVQSLMGADLKLADGSVLRNYQIKSVNKNKITILYIKPDGAPDMVVLEPEALPDDLREKLFPAAKLTAPKLPPKPRPEKTLQDRWMNYGDRMQFEIDQLAGDDIAGRRALGQKLFRALRKTIAPRGEVVDVAVVRIAEDGALLKIVGTGKGSKLRSGQLIFVYGVKPANSAFQQKIYPSGDRMDCGDLGQARIYGATVQLACAAAMDFIARYIGDDSFIWPEKTPQTEAVEKKAEEKTVFESESAPTTIVNNYYIKDDDDSFPIVVDRRPSRRPPPRRPGCRPRPKPGHKPGPKPAPKPRPNRGTLGNRPVHPRIVNSPTVVKNNGHSGNYGVLPRHLAPGTSPVKGKGR